MNIATFNMSLVESERTLKEFDLFKAIGIKSINTSGVSDAFKASARNNDYKSLFLLGLEKYDYDILLKDQSYFQFEFRQTGKIIEIRYAFYQNPINFKSYEDFLNDEIVSKGFASSIEEVKDDYYIEYDQYLNEQEINETALVIRYDADKKGYKPLVHSTSHFHIGYNNNMRIPVSKTLSPLKFVLFIIKHVYYSQWKTKAVTDIKYIEKKLELARRSLKDLDIDYWKANEKLELYIS